METRTTDLFQFFSGQTYDVKNIFLEYKKPIFDNVFFNNKQLLIQQCKYELFDNDRWVMRPHEFCQDIYGEQYFYPVILTVNNINSIFEFTSENFYKRLIITPNEDIIYKVLSMSST
jgi:hypothetical protein